MASIDTVTLPFEEKPLYKPSLEEIRDVIATGLASNFANVNVEVVDCPNLTQAPFHLAGEGLSGSCALLELGGPPFLFPRVDYTKLYDLVSILRKTLNDSKKQILAVGAGAGPYPYVNSNCEGMFNLKIAANGHITNESHIAQTTPDCKRVLLKKLPNTETRCALMANIFLSEGKPGKVLKVNCMKRTGNKDFIASIRTTLAQHYGDKTVGLGGVFLLKNGKAKQHVMSPFSEAAIHTEEELNTWLNFFDMSATLIAVGTMVTNECDLDLRLQHFHSFSKHGEGGHYHIDTTPDIVEYEGFFNVGEKIIRVDKPVHTHKFGRD
ncbi:ester hydrolase C11orf54 homolog [Toxorhynchites rutilus septentrionalis]|uniref:ester hydrolase C11orf54 homolog n=1 Tax=Toxorhynchites rutilus septentrionalis TaxID=329112 RepID=UPI002478DE16|nr:ester hydrolase C11orf54 homolog [Toxorhynchites rutilus septentrionalis]